MVSFVSLFLGLVLGPQMVIVQVADVVDRVEILLDGQLAIELMEAPWQGQIDLGSSLLPHELVAVAYDQGGTEIDRTTQWLNLPRQPAETTILLRRDDGGDPVGVQVSWESLVDSRPSSIQIELDGKPLEVDDPAHIPLPPHDPDLLHFLRVELEFGGIVRSTTELTFGGAYQDEVNSELTALPVTLTGRRRKPKPSEIQDLFVARGAPLQVAAIDKGPVDLIVVRDRDAWSRLRQVRTAAQRLPTGTLEGGRFTPSPRAQWFQPDSNEWFVWSFQLLWPVPTRRSIGDDPYDLFVHTGKYAGERGSLHGWLTTVQQPAESTGEQRLADAVAVAAVAAAGSNRRRAVLLVLGPDPEDTSEVTPDTVRRYLEALGVPLFVWSFDQGIIEDTPWGEVVDVSTPRLMSLASDRILRALNRQRIVWVEGKHLAHQVTVVDHSRGMALSSRLPAGAEEPVR